MTHFLKIGNNIININSITFIDLSFNLKINKYILEINIIGDRVKSFSYDEEKRAKQAFIALKRDLAATNSSLYTNPFDITL